MLMPKRVKHRKQHRGRRTGKASGGTVVSFGDFGLQAVESCWMTANQIEAARIAMNRYIRRSGKIWIRIFPDKPFTKKPAETRMGSGKGAPEGWVAVVKPGRVLFEMGGVSEADAREAMRLASHKLPIETKFIKREASVPPQTPKKAAKNLESPDEAGDVAGVDRRDEVEIDGIAASAPVLANTETANTETVSATEAGAEGGTGNAVEEPTNG